MPYLLRQEVPVVRIAPFRVLELFDAALTKIYAMAIVWFNRDRRYLMNN